MRHAARGARGSLSDRVRQLQKYAVQVRNADRQYQRLLQLENADLNRSRLTDMLSQIGADEVQTRHLSQLGREAQVTAEALREVMQMLAGTVSSLSSSTIRRQLG